MSRLLLVEDDHELAGLLGTLLDAEGYTVVHAGDGQRGLHLTFTQHFDVLVIDRMLPVLDGLQLLRAARRHGVSTPALLLTALGTVADRVDGLDAGAEDYLVKPFEIPELLARLRALLRRHSDAADRLPIGSRYLDVRGLEIIGVGQAPIQLSAREAALLRVLAARPTRTFTRGELLEQVFDPDDTPGLVDTYVHYLRRKAGRPVIRTVHGVGYRVGSL